MFSVKCINGTHDNSSNDQCIELKNVELMVINDSSKFIEDIVGSISEIIKTIPDRRHEYYYRTVLQRTVHNHGGEIRQTSILGNGDVCIVRTDNDSQLQVTDHVYITVPDNTLENFTQDDICRMQYCEYSCFYL